MTDGTVVLGSYGDPPPPDAELAEATRALRFEPLHAPAPTGVRGLLAMWREVAVNGGGFTASFAMLDVRPAAEWCLRTGRLERLDHPHRLLASAAMTAALPDRRTDPVMLHEARFTDLHPLRLEGDLAVTLRHGGAHREFPGTTEDARAIAADAAADLVGRRYDDVLIRVGFDGWAPWFGWSAWDRTWIITDRRRRTVDVLALTDDD